MPYRCNVLRPMATGGVDDHRHKIKERQSVITDMPCSAGHMNEKLSEMLARDVPIGRFYIRFPLNYTVHDNDSISEIRHLNGDEIYPGVEILHVQRFRNSQVAVARKVGR